MSKYDSNDRLKELQMRLLKCIDLLLTLEKEDINPYLKKRLLYLLNPQVNEYCEYIKFKDRVQYGRKK